jgi:hypothetical protein
VTERLLAIALVGLAGLAAPGTRAEAQLTRPEPFGFFKPIVFLSDGERARLDRGEAIVKMLPHADRELAIFSAARIGVDGDRLAAWVHQIADLKRSRHVTAIRRFSDPPRLSDVADLTLDDADLEALRRCRPGSCGVKLSEGEMASLGVVANAGPDWKRNLQLAFQRVVLARAQTYITSGHAGSPPYSDLRSPVLLQGEFARLLEQSAFLEARLPELVEHLRRYPHQPPPGIESFLYWSKENFGGKPIVSITHVTIVGGEPSEGFDVLVASKQVFATHYMTGSIALTAIVGGQGSNPRYLAYLNRSRVDVLGGFLGGLARRIMERRLRTDAVEVVQGLRTRLESGPPPG